MTITQAIKEIKQTMKQENIQSEFDAIPADLIGVRQCYRKVYAKILQE